MDEDLELNRLVKLALESREPFRLASSCGAVRRPVLRWGVPSLLAATLALAAVFRATLSLPSDRVSDAIRLPQPAVLPINEKKGPNGSLQT